jgi:DNA-binding CsgD family transcriptional regulator
MDQVPTLDDVILMPTFKKDDVLFRLLNKADEINTALLYIANFPVRKFEYMSPSCLDKTKYSLDFYLQGGADALYHIATPETKLSLIQQQVEYLNDLKQNYAPEEVKILEFPGILKSGNDELCEFLCLSLILTYTEDRDVDLAVILLVIKDVNNDLDIAHCKSLLHDIKLRHNEIYNHSISFKGRRPLTVIHVSSSRTDIRLSRREEETLKYLAQGMSTKDIGVIMNITDNTVETYRRNLLEKFEAKNAAELVKKASKIYWLE